VPLEGFLFDNIQETTVVTIIKKSAGV